MVPPVLTLPDEVILNRAEISSPRFTPRELRLIKAQTGSTLSSLLGDDASDEKFVVFGWLKLRRMGHELDLADMDDVILCFDLDADDAGAVAPADPTGNGNSTGSSISADGGA